VVFFSHATSFWDWDSSSLAGTRRLLEFARENAITTIAAVHGGALQSASVAEQYFIRGSEVNYVVVSEAGQHKLSFPNARNIYLAGGNLTLCLCEAIRDTVRGTVATSEALNIILVKDAIYDWDSGLDPITQSQLEKFVSGFFIPSFNCPWQNYYQFPPMRLSDFKLEVFFGGKFFKAYDLEPGDATPLEDLEKSIRVHFSHSSELSVFR
jgi:hypothetical protein